MARAAWAAGSGKVGVVEALGIRSEGAVSVRLDNAVVDTIEGTGLVVDIVGVTEQHLVWLGDADGDQESELELSPSMEHALSKPTEFSLDELEGREI